MSMPTEKKDFSNWNIESMDVKAHRVWFAKRRLNAWQSRDEVRTIVRDARSKDGHAPRTRSRTPRARPAHAQISIKRTYEARRPSLLELWQHAADGLAPGAASALITESDWLREPRRSLH